MKLKFVPAFVVLCFASASAFAQATFVNYSTGGTNVPGYTGFFNSSDGWNISGAPLWQGQKGWGGTGSGADSINIVANVTPTGGPGTNASGTLGFFVPSLPLNTNYVYLDRVFNTASSFSLTNATVRLVAEWSLLDFDTNSPAFESDIFNIDVRNAANTASLLNFKMGTNNVGVGYNYLVTSTGSATQNQFDAGFGSLYRMQVDITDTGAFSGFVDLLNPVTRTNLTNSLILNSGFLAGGATAYDVGALRLGWQLTDGVNDPGILGIAVNEFTVTSSGTVIPEPGTWAAGAFLAVAGAYAMRRRRKAEAAA
jgi:hypothetical protein